jgi:putative transposase
MQEGYRVSLRKACRASGTAMSSMLYRPVRPDQTPLRQRIKEIATNRVSYGYRRVQVLLRREGWRVNAKRTYRLYREEGLCLRSKRPKRRRMATHRQETITVTGTNQLWAMDLASDALADGRKLRALTVLDTFTCECVALEASASFGGAEVARVLTREGVRRGLPAVIHVNGGAEFTSKSFGTGPMNHLRLDFRRPGKPTDNPFIESFNGQLRRECLSQHYFLSVIDTWMTLEAWREEYNNRRRHGSLGQRTPTEYRAEVKAAEALAEVGFSVPGCSSGGRRITHGGWHLDLCQRWRAGHGRFHLPCPDVSANLPKRYSPGHAPAARGPRGALPVSI